MQEVFLTASARKEVKKQEGESYMRCTQCGAENVQGSRFCMNCGGALFGQSRQYRPVQQNVQSRQMPGERYTQPQQRTVQRQPQQTGSMQNQQMYQNQRPNQQMAVQPSASGQLPMKWYKFIIYAQLFLNAVSNALAAVLSLTGFQYYSSDMKYMGMDPAEASEMVYGFYPNLRVVDIIYGIMLICLAVFALIVRMQLAKFKKNAPMLYYAFWIFSVAVSVIYLVALATINIAGVNYTQVVSSIVVSIALLVINIIYFNKRKHLFTN